MATSAMPRPAAAAAAAPAGHMGPNRRPASARHRIQDHSSSRGLGLRSHKDWMRAPQGPSSLICNVTNDNAEVFPPGSDDDPTDPKTLPLEPWADPNTPNPELGDLRSRVPHDWFDLVQDNMEFKEDMEYWFQAPPGGWKPKSDVQLEVIKPVAAQIMSSAEHLGPNRTKLSEFKEGQVLTGEIVEMSMFHGFQIDLGGEYDGMIPVESKYMWDKLKPECQSSLNISQEVKVRIHKIRDPEIYRWPIQLVLESPFVECLNPENYDPDSWRCPKDLRNVNTPEQLAKFFTPEEIAEATANFYPDMKQYDIWSDGGYDEVYYYQEEHIDGEGLPFDKWVPVPKGKDGKQKIGYFIRQGINVASHSAIYGTSHMHPWNDKSMEADMEIALQAMREAAPSDSGEAYWE